MLLVDDAKNRFEIFKIFKQNIGKYANNNLSESDTRSKLIDYLLIEVLGWDENNIKREGHVNSGYYDYIISIPGINFIIEAKKSFIEFVLPSNHKKVTIKSIYHENKEVIDQLRSYCMESGIPYGIITNGKQYIFLKTFNNDGNPWKDNTCLIFNNLDEIDKRFIEFYENISKYALLNNGGFKYDLPIKNIEYKTIISTLIDKDKELVRNSMSAKITPMIDKIFGEIFAEENEDDIEFIKKCFVENEETKKNKNEIERLFGDYAPKLTGVIPAINTSSIVGQIKDEIANDNTNISSSAPKPIIIIGSKGAGKTTFINHLFKFRINEKENENHYGVYIDFRKFFEKETLFDPDKIAGEIIEGIYTKYEDLQLYSLNVQKRVYIKEIKRNDASIWQYDKDNDIPSYNKKIASFIESAQNDKLSHLEKLSQYFLRERRKRLLVIIDNADQFNDTIQEKIFIFSHSLSRAALCGTIISLREGYYYKWRFTPPFDAYESNVYHITAPKYTDILQRRIDFAIEKLERIGNFKGTKDEDIINKYIPDFLLGLKNSLFADQNSDLIDYLSYTTYPDIREGLRVFKLFLTSGHTKISEYITRERTRSKDRSNIQIIPIHEFVKSIGLQNKEYYNSEISIIQNIFLPSVDSTDHFFKLYIIKTLYDLIEARGNTGKFISNKDLIEKFNLLGYRINTINIAIIDLIKLNLINTEDQITDIDWTILPDAYNICITSKGHYYYKELINRFHYLDLVLQDCPIFDNKCFENIRLEFPLSNEIGKRNLPKRIATALEFINYLKVMEDKQPRHLITVFGRMVDGINTGFHQDLDKIKRTSDMPGSLNL